MISLSALPIYVWLLAVALPLSALIIALSPLPFLWNLKGIIRGRKGWDSLNERGVYRFYTLVEKRITPDSPLLTHPVFTAVWLGKFRNSGGRKWLELIDRYGVPEGLFECFLICLRKASSYPALESYLDENGWERLGRSCPGGPFDREKGSRLTEGRKGELARLLASNRWQTRYFAYSLLMNGKDDISRGLVEKGFTDQSRVIRELLATGVSWEERERVYRRLKDLVLMDPVVKVRTAAGQRINREFSDLKDFDYTVLEGDRILSMIGMMSPDSDGDEAQAVILLDRNDDRIIWEAARFLEAKGTLSRLFRELYPGDRKGFERDTALLAKAARVNVVRFFQDKQAWERGGALLGAARILKGRGDLAYLEKLARTVFSRNPYGSALSREIYHATVEAIDVTGSDACHKLKSLELKKHRNDPFLMNLLLQSIPREREFFYLDDLFHLLEKGEPSQRTLIRKRLCRFQPSLIVTPLYDLLLNDESDLDLRGHVVLILASLGLDYTLPLILENLPLVSEEDWEALSAALENFDEDTLAPQMAILFDACDRDIHLGLIRSMPPFLAPRFEKTLLAFLDNPDGELRKAVLLGMDRWGGLPLEKGWKLLEDPLDEIREITVSQLMDGQGDKILDVLIEIIETEDESRSVKEAVVNGIFRSCSPRGWDYLFDLLTQETEWGDYFFSLLPGRADGFVLQRVIDYYRISAPPLRKRMKPVILAFGQDMDDPLRDLITSLEGKGRDILSRLLIESGYVSRLALRLNSTDRDRRIRAVEILIALGTREALKTALMAVNDPLEEVRIAVVRALERMDTPRTFALLDELAEDGNGKVRRYAQWARERRAVTRG